MKTCIFLALGVFASAAHGAVDRTQVLALLVSDQLLCGEVRETGSGESGSWLVFSSVDDEGNRESRHFGLKGPMGSQVAVGKSVCIGMNKFPILGLVPNEHPELAVFEQSRQELESAKAEAATAAKAWLARQKRCPPHIRKAVKGLRRLKNQSSIDSLWKSVPLESAELGCLVRQLTDITSAKATSFATPYGSWEGRYNHGVISVGELVGLLLPHLADQPIHGRRRATGPDLEQLQLAWAYYGNTLEMDRLASGD